MLTGTRTSGGRFRLGDLTAPGKSGGMSGLAWRGIDPGKKLRHWNTPTKGGMSDFMKQHIPGWPDDYETVHDRLEVMDEHDFIHEPPNGGMPCLKRYLAASKGRAVNDVFSDIPRLEAASKENRGYPTQKPSPLVERLILATTNPGDLVGDWFVGCATTPVAAEKLERQWVAADVSEKSYELVQKRFVKELGPDSDMPIYRNDAPVRTDLGDIPIYNCKKNVDYLFGTQRGKCNLCEKPLGDDYVVDHIVPKKKEDRRKRTGLDHISNLQLLHSRCNLRKGTKPWPVAKREYWEEQDERRRRR